MKFEKYVEEIKSISERVEFRIASGDDMDFFAPYFKGMALGVFYMSAKECFPEEERDEIMKALSDLDDTLDRRFNK